MKDASTSIRSVHVVIGTRENVYQDTVGGNFEPHPEKEIVRIFTDESEAENFVRNSRLKTPKKQRYGDTAHYKQGYYELEIESHKLE